jgi:presenilin-like A22 family membrane protease
MFDISLPAAVSLITIAIVWLFPKFKDRAENLFVEKKFSALDAVFLVVAMGVMVTLIAFIPGQAIQILFLGAYSFILFLFTYIALDEWLFAILPPALFLILYFSPLWSSPLVTLFAIVFIVSITVYVGSMFSWSTVLIFSALITVMDIIQVFGTRFMGQAATKVIQLKLPVAIQVATFPVEGQVLLGLGDLFLAGLLSIQTSRRLSKRAGLLSAISIGAAFFIYETLAIHFNVTSYFPATVIVVCGWLLGYGFSYFMDEYKLRETDASPTNRSD